MELKGIRVAVIATTDDMIERFMPPHIKYLSDAGATIDCFCKNTGFDLDNLSNIKNVNVKYIDFTRFPFTINNLKGYKKLKQIFKENKYDLISCLQPVGGVLGRLVGKKFKVKTIYTAHGFHFYKGCPLKNKLIYRTIEKYCSKYTDALVTINNEDYEAAKTFKAKKVYKINGIGVDLNKYNPNKNLDKLEFRRTLELDADDFVVTSVGELNENKNTFRILKVMKEIDNPKLKYVICGTGKLYDEYKKFIDENNLQSKVRLLGFRKDIPEILGISNVYIMPSYREGLSKSMMEAMCYGLPIIASRIRGNTDLLGDNEGGILCEPANNDQYKQAISVLYNDRDLCQRLGKRNSEFVKNFDIDIVLSQMKKIYKEI